jgi:hypothetical protein
MVMISGKGQADGRMHRSELAPTTPSLFMTTSWGDER